MSKFPSPPRRKTWIAALALIGPWCAVSYAQNFSVMVTNPDPLGLGNFVPDLITTDLGVNGNLKGDFRYGLGVQSVYSSNFFQAEDNAEGEFSIYVNPWLSYTSDPEGGAPFSLAGNYRPSGRYYVENGDLDGWDQSGDVSLSFVGAKTQVSVFGSYNQASGVDLLTGEFLESTITAGGIRANRQIAPRTSLDASWTVSKSEYGSSDNVGADVYTTILGGYWAATERLSFGPTLRYTASNSDNIGSSDAWALMAAVRYRMGERFFLSAALGPEYVKFSGDGGDDDSTVNVAMNFTASYMIDERWSCSGSIVTALAPSSSQQDTVINNWAISAAVNRKLVRGVLSGGLDCNISGDSEVSSADEVFNKQQNWGAFIQYQRPFFSDRIGFNSELRYVVNTGSSDWQEVQISAGLDVSF